MFAMTTSQLANVYAGICIFFKSFLAVMLPTVHTYVRFAPVARRDWSSKLTSLTLPGNGLRIRTYLFDTIIWILGYRGNGVVAPRSGFIESKEP